MCQFEQSGTQVSASRPTHAGRPDSDKVFPLPPKIKIPNLHIVPYMCQFEQYLSHRQNECRAHPRILSEALKMSSKNTKLTHCSIYVSIQTISFPQTK